MEDLEGNNNGTYCLSYEEIEGVVLARFEETILRAYVLREVEDIVS